MLPEEPTMGIDLLHTLSSNNEFRAAVFLTYTLDLQFFEQMVAPILDSTRCTSVLIISDAAGYDDALARGAQNLSGVGTRYVCVRLPTSGSGIQHGKLVLLTGAHTGRLLVGSGNLTLHGFGRNLELFDQYDVRFDSQQHLLEGSAYPFRAVYRLLEEIRTNTSGFTTAASMLLDQISHNSSWIITPQNEPIDLQLWSSVTKPLIQRIALLEPVEELQIISPFFDLHALQALLQALCPARLRLGVDSSKPHLDGTGLLRICSSSKCTVQVQAIDGTPRHRPLHAKAIIGITETGAWCLSGSANCTRPALLGSWGRDGNLELVTWRRSDDPHAFDELWHDTEVHLYPRDPASFLEGAVIHPVVDLLPYSAELLELSYQSDVIQGRVQIEGQLPARVTWILEFLRSREYVNLIIRPDGHFSVALAQPLEGVEAGRVVVSDDGHVLAQSGFLWLDQPAELYRHAKRAFFLRIQESMRTFSGAGQLFQDLLNFLWERVDPQNLNEQHQEIAAWRMRNRRNATVVSVDGPPPPVEDFIVDDDTLVAHISRRLSQGSGGDQTALSVQDLLSLVLLRLTEPTKPRLPDAAGDEGPDVERDSRIIAEHEDRQRIIQEQISNYLLRYCRAYTRRLCDKSFLSRLSPERLFENHALLCRILLEIADKCGTTTAANPAFTRDHFRECTLGILGALYWSAGAGLDGDNAWDVLCANGHAQAELVRLCDIAELTVLAAELVAQTWGEPPPWQRGLHNPSLVQTYLRTRELLQRMEQALGQRFWYRLESVEMSTISLFGFRRPADLHQPAETSHVFDRTLVYLDKLAAYRTPIEERFAPIIAWADATGRNTQQLTALRVRFPDEVALFEIRPNARLLASNDALTFCPGCHMQLAKNVITQIRRGQLAACNNCRKSILYYRPSLKL